MANSIITDGLSLVELQAFRTKLQSMYFGGVVQSTFQGQTIIFRSRRDLRDTLTEVSECIQTLESSTATAPKKAKRIIMSAKKDKGF